MEKQKNVTTKIGDWILDKTRKIAELVCDLLLLIWHIQTVKNFADNQGSMTSF